MYCTPRIAESLSLQIHDRTIFEFEISDFKFPQTALLERRAKRVLAFFDQQVVKEACRAEARGQQRQARAAQARHRLQGFCIDHFRLIQLRQRFPPDVFAHRRSQSERVALATLDGDSRGIERAVQHVRGTPLVRRKIRVA